MTKNKKYSDITLTEAENEKIVLDGVQKAKDDDKIKYEYQKPEEVLAHLKLKAE